MLKTAGRVNVDYAGDLAASIRETVAPSRGNEHERPSISRDKLISKKKRELACYHVECFFLIVMDVYCWAGMAWRKCLLVQGVRSPCRLAVRLEDVRGQSRVNSALATLE